MNPAANSNVIQRLTQVRLLNYRGFKVKIDEGQVKVHELDTDADIVLITGPNGHGKTSLMEALLLLLTGWYGADPAEHLISRLTKKPGQEDAESAGECEIAAFVEYEDERPGSRRLHWTKKHAGALPLPENYASRLSDGGETVNDRELDARLCAFFQDRVDLLFDKAAKGRTLNEIFVRVPQAVRRVARLLPLLKEDLEDELGRYSDDWAGRGESELNASLAERWRLVGALLRELASIAPSRPADWPVPDNISDDTDLDTFARDLITRLVGGQTTIHFGELRRTFKEAVEGTLDRWMREARRAAVLSSPRTAKLQAELDAARERLERLRHEFPNLDEEVQRFESAAPDEPGLPSASAVFRSLMRNASRWAAPLPDEADTNRLQRVLEEFAAVEEQEAAKCAELLETWLQPRMATREERECLERRIPELEDEIRRSLMSEKLAQLEELERRLKEPLSDLQLAWEERHRLTMHRLGRGSREQARALIDAAAQTVGWFHDEVERLTELTKEEEEQTGFKKEICRRSEVVLRRFSLVDGIVPLVLKDDKDNKTYQDSSQHQPPLRIETADGRLLEHLSTGQKAQVAVSMLVAQNLAVSDKLTHRVILLDDVTTAYDLSNLTREAILWRQLAYGTQDEQMRRQLFISSHHEDMTNHMLDLLVPPPDRCMLMIRFTGWSQEDGPRYDIYEVEPSAIGAKKDGAGKDGDAPKRESLAKDLERF